MILSLQESAAPFALAGAKPSSNHHGSQFSLESSSRGYTGSTLKLQASVPNGMWYVLTALLKEYITLAQH